MAADAYCQDLKDDLDVRFDIISVLKKTANDLEIHHIENAFQSHEI